MPKQLSLRRVTNVKRKTEVSITTESTFTVSRMEIVDHKEKNIFVDSPTRCIFRQLAS